jgi:hypothetical protein
MGRDGLCMEAVTDRLEWLSKIAVLAQAYGYLKISWPPMRCQITCASLAFCSGS